MTDALREAFEKWITDPPYESQVDRYPDDPSQVAWPGHYQDITVQLAWEAWQEGFRTALQEPAPVVAPDRELLGKLVRWQWVKWAREQPSAKPSWLTPWDELTEPERDVDRRIGEAIWRYATTTMYDAAAPQAPVEPAPVVQPVDFPLCVTCGQPVAWQLLDSRGAPTDWIRFSSPIDETETYRPLYAAPSQLVEDARAKRTMREAATWLTEYADELQRGHCIAPKGEWDDSDIERDWNALQAIANDLVSIAKGVES